jgi:uncharacterized protein
MPRPIHFDITADNPDAVAGFYGDVFGWQFQKFEAPGAPDYWLITTGKDEMGIDGGLSRRDGRPAVTTNTIGVPSLDEYTAKVTAKGGKVTAPKMPIPGVGWLAYCEDPDGTSFGIIQMDESASF